MATKVETSKGTSKSSCGARFGAVFLLYLILLFMLFFPIYGVFPNIRQEDQDALFAFSAASISSIIIVFLIPVIVRGSFGRKILAVILLLPATWFGFLGWQAIVFLFREYPFGQN